MDDETRAYFEEMRREIGALRAEVGAQGSELRAETRAMGSDLRAEMQTMGAELRGEMQVMEGRLRDQIRFNGILVEGVRDEVHALAEAVIHNGEAIATLRAEVSRGMDERLAVVHAALRDVRRNIDAWRGPREPGPA